ncbi:MAG TPA: hypothetical protein VHE35_24545 [Kofleriaceae bacterium]|nr:hypothetical protein [Kofleriaceae bacterium]
MPFASRLRTLACLALLPIAGCDLYFRSGDSDDLAPPDGNPGLPDARVDVDAQEAIDAGEPDAPPTPPPNGGFVTPTSTAHANVRSNGGWTDLGAADWSCVTNPPAETLPDSGYTLTGTVRDYASNQGVGGVTIDVSAGGMTLASATSSTAMNGGTRGTYRITVPALPEGATRLRFTQTLMGARKTIAIDRYLGSFAIATFDPPLMTEQTARTLPGLVGVQADPDTGLIVGEVRDCQGRQVSGAIVALSTSSQFVAHWPGGETYYFSAATNNDIPVRQEVRTQTNQDGRFMLIGAVPDGAEGTIQAWGFQTDADRAGGALKLLGRSAAVVEAQTVSSVLIGRSRGFATGN